MLEALALAGAGQSFGSWESMTEALDLIGASDLLLPGQSVDGSSTVHEKLRLRPEYRLMMAIFIDWLNEYRSRAPNPQRRPRARSEMLRWIRSDSVHDLFAFGSICMHFGWEPEWLAPRILTWMDRIDGGWRPSLGRRTSPRDRKPGANRTMSMNAWNRRRKD